MNATTLKNLHNKNLLGWLLVNAGLFLASLLAVLLQAVGAVGDKYNKRSGRRVESDNDSNSDWFYDPTYSDYSGNVYHHDDD